MFEKFFTQDISKNTPKKTFKIVLVETKSDLKNVLSEEEVAFLKAQGFKATVGELSYLSCEKIIFCLKKDDTLSSFAILSSKLPAGIYELDLPKEGFKWDDTLLGWALGHYGFEKYKTMPLKKEPRILKIAKTTDCSYAKALFEAICLVRDLINTPANEMMPKDLKKVCEGFTKTYGASLEVLEGKELLKANYPLIYAVGKASCEEPLLLDLRWSSKKPCLSLCLVGKGVCFDSGGLDIKPSSGMLTMKKDMGGAAHVLGLAHAIMSLNLPVKLRVLIPAVENAISGSAMRPLDVYSSRSKKTVEIGNTDAEGRLILADALFEGACEKPDWLINFATLTGAARVALGPNIPVIFSNKSEEITSLLRLSLEENDPLWQLPLYEGYKDSLKSSVADLSSTGSSSYGGAITAALFLQEFVPKGQPWIHVDLMAWNLKSRPGFPEGGEAMGLRSFLLWIQSLLKKRSKAPRSSQI